LAQLTESQFIANHFATEVDLSKGYDRLYKTGNLVRWSVDKQGNPDKLEYIGRNDGQMNICGFRIEPAEIQNLLIELPQVQQAVVVAHKGETNAFVRAYIISQSEKPIEGLCCR
jgi:acyl-coenzyme A synthetase/AMP-(fatty) acid ligase